MTPILIYGPTASGKSSLAMDLARDLNGVILNGDSLQIYKDLEILTARPPKADTDAVPHRLYGILPAEEGCSVGKWVSLVTPEIRDLLKSGKTPIVVGGTGLYLKSLLMPLSPIPPVPFDIHQDCESQQKTMGQGAFYEYLKAIDPEAARGIEPQDTQRTLRAVAVYKATGRPLSKWFKVPGMPPEFRFYTLYMAPPKQDLLKKAEVRFHQMMGEGAVEEVRRVVGLYPWTRLEKPPFEKAPLQKALGFYPLYRYLTGDIKKEEAIELSIIQTRQYIKRQYTWMKHQLPKPGIIIDELYSNSLKQRVLTSLNQ